MNFETKYLIRWGIPGWIMILTLGPYLYIYYESARKVSVNLIAVGAILTVIGVPLGYLLNQIHHSLTWVIVRCKIIHKIFKKDNWDEYFEKELKLDELFFKGDEGAKKQERYRYLLSRKHELGGVTVSLGISLFTIFLINVCDGNNKIWSWLYFIVVVILFFIILISRNYSSRNVEKYFKKYLDEI
jgi:hypothetical protein